MHTIFVILGGLLLLAAVFGAAHLTGRPFRVFLPWYLLVWLICTAVNMWIGVTQAGYSVMEELPILILTFGVPALAAVLLSRRSVETRVRKIP